jgi:cation:H+ antiporter
MIEWIDSLPRSWVLIGLGLLLLSFGAEFLIRSAVDIATRLNVSPLLIGLTLVGFGTSTPELVTSIQAALMHSPGIAIGNITGSNIANILLILGLSAVLMPVAVSFGAVWRDGLFVIATAVLLAWAGFQPELSRELGLAALALLAFYVLFAWFQERSRSDPTQGPLVTAMSLPSAIFVAIAVLGVLIVGATMLVDGGVAVAKEAGISEEFVGLTLVAVGTSLPELFTSVVAAARRQADISVGNILGSNIYNILGVGGVTAVIHPLTIPAQIATFDNFVLVAASVLLVLCLLAFRGIGRAAGRSCRRARPGQGGARCGRGGGPCP